jgi:hypothetical protein
MTSARIFASSAIGFGGQPAINDLLSAGYTTVIVWSVHVDCDGTLYLNDNKIVAGGAYCGAFPFNLPNRLAQLRKAGIEIIFSVGAGGTSDFTNIGNLLNGQPASLGNPIYDNFKALKGAMKTVDGGDIDAIDFDNEDNMNAGVMINFGITLANIGYANVTFCPYDYSDKDVWSATMKGLVSAKGSAFVNAIHLQVYSGGRGNVDKVGQWKDVFTGAGGKALMIPGLATNQAKPGPWWYEGQKGGSVLMKPNVAMFEGANWDQYLYTWNFSTVEEALQGAQTAASFFFYCRGPLNLSWRSFQRGDAVYFTGLPWWGPAFQCDGYYLGGPCTDIWNPKDVGACPKDLRTQYAIWNKSFDGGFIWMYDSIVSCLQSGCCAPTGTALAYRQAITG